MNCRLIVLAAASLALMVSAAMAQPTTAPLDRLATTHAAFVDAHGEPVILKGCNLGNWLMIEPWMIGAIDAKDQAGLIQSLTDRFGDDRAQTLLDTYRDGFMQPRDMELIRSFGFNVIRVPFDYRLIQSDIPPYAIKKDGFRWLDRAVSLAENAGMYVILDLHGAPGGQSREAHTGQSQQNHLWGNETDLNRTADVWRAVAARYADRPCVAAYDLLNEPYGDFRTDLRKDLKDISGRLYTAIRSVDDHTIILLPGSLNNGISFYDTPAKNGYKNVGFTEHFYPGLYGTKPGLNAHARLLNQRWPARAEWLKSVDAPYLVGEFNVVLQSNGGDRVMREYFDRCAANGWAATMWTYKMLSADGGMGPNNWGMVANAKSIDHLDLRTASYEQVLRWFQQIGTMELAVNEPLRQILTQHDVAPLPLDSFPAPPHRIGHDNLPADWTAADIGDPTPGGQTVDQDSMTLFAGGEDIFGWRDAFRFAGRALQKVDLLEATVSPPLDTSEYAKAGLMIRFGGGADATFVMLNVFPDKSIGFCSRSRHDEAAVEQKLYPGLSVDKIGLRLKIDDGAVSAFYRDAAGDWKPAGKVDLPGALHGGRIGFAVCSHDSEWLTRATFSDFSKGSRP